MVRCEIDHNRQVNLRIYTDQNLMFQGDGPWLLEDDGEVPAGAGLHPGEAAGPQQGRAEAGGQGAEAGGQGAGGQGAEAGRGRHLQNQDDCE